MHSTSPKFSAHFWRVCLLVSSCLLSSVSAHADDLFWGSTDGSKLVEYDASNNTLLSRTFSGQSYTQFTLINTTNNQLGASLWIGFDSANSTLYGIDSSNHLYTIDTSHLVSDVNHDVGFAVTTVATPNLNASNVKGIAFTQSGLLDISNGSSLFQYNLTAQSQTTLESSFTDGQNTLNIGGIAFGQTGTLYGLVYSPQSAVGPDINTSTNHWSNVVSPSNFHPSSQADVFITSVDPNLLYFTDGNNHVYSFNLTNNHLGGPLTVSGAGGNIQSFAFDPVPEPPISIMLGFGVVCLLGWRYQHRLACA
jgi:hypothetical protein